MPVGKPAAFLSYVHSDDDHDNGRISKLRERLEGEVRMHTGRPFHIFQDRNDLEWGQNWQERIEASIAEVTFLVPIITPSYFNSPACRREYELFLLRESSLGTNQLILPIYYLTADAMTEETSDQVGRSLQSRQYSDWRAIRFDALDGPQVAKQLAELAVMIKNRIDEIGSIIESARASTEPPATELTTDAFLRRFAERDVTLPPPLVRLLTEGELGEPTVAPSDAVQDEPTEPYKIFTREFDEVIEAEEFLIGKSGFELSRVTATIAAEMSKKYRGTIVKFERDLKEFVAGRPASVTILADNSGSLRGEPVPMLAGWSLSLAEIFDDVGFETEVIGFTTRAWKGGQAREKWLEAGRPPRPGRLNDLRYIIYKDFARSFVECVQNFGVMMRESILKENIDGEAVQFAASRLTARPSDLRLLIVLSDGSPMDDSTAHENGSGYLQRHLKQVISEVDTSKLKVMAVGINHDLSEYYGHASRKSAPDRIGIDVLNLVRSQLKIPVRPPAKQAATTKR